MKINSPTISTGSQGSIQSWITLDFKKSWKDESARSSNTVNMKSIVRTDNTSNSEAIKKTPLTTTEKRVEPVIAKKEENTSKPTTVNTQAKIDYVAQLWGNTGYAVLFVNQCKTVIGYEDDCIMRGSSIAKHESCAGKCSNAFFGVLVDRKQSTEWQIKRWVKRYVTNKWYLRDTTTKWISGAYCTHENDGTPWCPNWKQNVGKLVNNYDNLF